MRLLAPVPAKRGKNHVFISYAREDAATHNGVSTESAFQQSDHRLE